MLSHLFLFLGISHAYIATVQVPVSPKALIAQMQTKKIDLGRTPEEKLLVAELKSGKVQLDSYMPEPQLVSLKKELASNEKNLDTAKLLAKIILYQTVESRWLYDIEYTILNDIGASQFSQFAPSLIDVLQTQTRYMGNITQNGKVYLRFQIADWGFISIEKHLKEAKVNIEFDSNADNNHISDSVKKLKSRE